MNTPNRTMSLLEEYRQKAIRRVNLFIEDCVVYGEKHALERHAWRCQEEAVMTAARIRILSLVRGVAKR